MLLCCTTSEIQAKEMAITFDDAPRVANGYLTGPERAKRLIESLSQHGIHQVTFFANSKRLDDEGLKRLNTYADAGHFIANHTHDHPDFNKTNLKVYIENFLTAHAQLSSLTNFKKLFRFPYLREGDTQEKRDGMRALIAKHGYFNAYITLNNYDWYIETLFQNAIKQNRLKDHGAVREFYVQQLLSSIEYYDQMAIKYLGRSPKHVLLLHENDVAALFIGDLIDALSAKGWRFISLEEAYSDEIAQYQTQQLLKYNPGRIGEIAKDKGQNKGLWHHSLDETYLKQQFDELVQKSGSKEWK